MILYHYYLLLFIYCLDLHHNETNGTGSTHSISSRENGKDAHNGDHSHSAAIQDVNYKPPTFPWEQSTGLDSSPSFRTSFPSHSISGYPQSSYIQNEYFVDSANTRAARSSRESDGTYKKGYGSPLSEASVSSSPIISSKTERSPLSTKVSKSRLTPRKENALTPRSNISQNSKKKAVSQVMQFRMSIDDAESDSQNGKVEWATVFEPKDTNPIKLGLATPRGVGKYGVLFGFL